MYIYLCNYVLRACPDNQICIKNFVHFHNLMTLSALSSPPTITSYDHKSYFNKLSTCFHANSTSCVCLYKCQNGKPKQLDNYIAPSEVNERVGPTDCSPSATKFMSIHERDVGLFEPHIWIHGLLCAIIFENYFYYNVCVYYFVPATVTISFSCRSNLD